MDFLNFLDTIKLPFELPILMHPITVHFAIALPIITILLEITNLFLKKPYLHKITLTFLFFTILIYLVAFFAGKTDGSEAFSLLSQEGKEELKLHKSIGMYLVYATFFIFLLKILAMLIKKDAAKAIYLVGLLVFIGVTIKQGKDGGELVYEYGANVKAISVLDDKLMELEDEIDELNDKLKKCEESLKIEKEKTSIKELTPQNIETNTTISKDLNKTIE